MKKEGLYAGEQEVRETDEYFAKFPDDGEIWRMTRALGLKKDSLRMTGPNKAWDYFHELKAMMKERGLA